MQRLGKNHGGYFGERIDIHSVLHECEAAAQAHGWTKEIFHESGEFKWFAFHRAPLSTINSGQSTRYYISAGIHGDEPAAPLAALKLLRENNWPVDAEIFLLPCLNPVGYTRNSRENEDGVDLNRDYRHPQCASTRAHIAWLKRQPKFDLYLCLHEDWEANGFYLYETNANQRAADILSADQTSGGREENGSAGETPTARCKTSRTEQMVDAVRAVCPIDHAEIIEGREAHGGIIRPNITPAERPQWPEAVWLLVQKARQGYTLEGPSDFELNVRVNALVAAVNAAIHA